MQQFNYQGQLDPNVATSEFNAHVFLIRQLMAKNSHVAMVKVIACTNSGGVSPVGFVDLQPLVNQVDGAKNATPHGVIHGCPYFRIQGGSNAIIIDPQVGDIGFALFADRDISSVIANASNISAGTLNSVNPASARKFDMSDGLYIGGVLNQAPSQYIQFLPNNIKIVSPQIDLSSWTGMIVAFGMGATPAGWLSCPTTQTLVSTTTYANLFAVLGYTWGGSGGSFGLPYFAAGYVPLANAGLGVLSHGIVINHTHYYYTMGGGSGIASGGTVYTNLPNQISGDPVSPQGGLNNLAAGMGVNWCVKY